MNDSTEVYTFNINYGADVFVIPVYSTMTGETVEGPIEEYLTDVSIIPLSK